MKKILLAGVCLLLTVGAFAETKELRSFSMPSPRSRALGGDHVAYAGGVDALFVNPAELRRKNEFSVLNLSLSATNPLWINKVAYELKGGFEPEKVLALIPTDPMRLPLGLDVQGPLALGFVSGGFGIGVFDRIYLDARIKGLNVELGVNADLTMNVGYAYRFDLGDRFKIDAGIGAKIFGRATANVNKGLTELLEDIDGGFTLDMFGLSKLPLLVGGTANLGGAVHLSFLPTAFNDDFTVGVVWSDVFSYAKEVMNLSSYVGLDEDPTWEPSEDVYTIPTSVQIGVSYSFNLGKLLRIAVMADHNDAVGLCKYIDSTIQEDGAWITMRDPLLDTTVGAEVTLFNIVSVRAGMRDLLPAVGLGLDLFIFKLDAALYGKELGMYPGDFTTMALDIGMNFKW
ncbi:MAG: hypothetical protein LBO67_07005 [Spirochaetaceae bacterium]|jgi:hypothetical protein|nr:hypothetical protein [Spirochaetaceae bacterium]